MSPQDKEQAIRQQLPKQATPSWQTWYYIVECCGCHTLHLGPLSAFLLQKRQQQVLEVRLMEKEQNAESKALEFSRCKRDLNTYIREKTRYSKSTHPREGRGCLKWGGCR